MSPRTTVGFCALALLGGSAAMAADSGWYLGAGAGVARAEIDDPDIRDQLLLQGFTTSSIVDDDTHFAWKLFGGYQFGRHFALEGGYFDLGEFGYLATTVPAGTLRGDITVAGWNLDAVVLLPFTERWSAFARAGAQHADAKVTFAGTGAVNVLAPRSSKDETNYKFGFGLQFAPIEALALRAEVERYRIDDAVGNKGDIDLLSLGLIYRFGRDAPVVAARAAEPAPVVYEAPVVVVVPVAEQTERYCSILDFQFEVNQDDIQREEKEKFAVLGTFLNKYPATTAVIEGHTDDVGSSENNLRLSQRRAENVVSYLVSTLHVTATRLKAVGYGESRPIADNGTEEGKRMNRRIGAVVACATDLEGLTVKPARMTMALQVEFDSRDAAIRPEYHDEIGRLATFLKANPTVTATVEGHTGNLQATPEAAMQMSQQRAQNVVNYLVDKFGIARSRLSAQGFGGTRRTAYNTSLEGQQENRRVNVIINYPK